MQMRLDCLRLGDAIASVRVRSGRRRLAMATELGSGAVQLVGFTGSEAISRPYRCELKLRVDANGLDPSNLVGKGVWFALPPEEDGPEGARVFSGYIATLSHEGRSPLYHQLTAEVVPWT